MGRTYRKGERRPESRDEAGNLLCGANLTSGKGTCKNRAGFGTSHPGIGLCKMHFGSTPAQTALAIKEGVRNRHFPWVGASRDIDPGEALLEEVHRTAGHVLELQVVLMETEDPVLSAAYVKELTYERQHLARVSQMAIAAGISERMVRLAEMQVDATLQLVEGVLTDLGLTQEQQEQARVSMAKRLRAVG